MKYRFGVLLISGVLLAVAIIGYADMEVEPHGTPLDFTSSGHYFLFNSDKYVAVNQTMLFHYFFLDTDRIQFNDTCFMCDADERVNLTLDFLAVNVTTAGEGEYILRFYVDSASSLVFLNLSEAFVDDYVCYKDDVFDQGVYSVDDNVSFNCSNPSDTFVELRRAMTYDIVVDTSIDDADLSSFLSEYGSSGVADWIREDINDDGVVDYLDRSKLQHYLGSSY